MPIATRTFRVFVSSTFEDLKEERDALQREVFPKLRMLCEQHGARFQAIDLRWGVRDEAALDQQTMEICLREIRRCQATGVKPNFIVLLGDRYGWQPLPARIPITEFNALLPHIPAGEARTLAGQWYRLDENAVPPEYCLQPRTGRFVTPDAWNPVEQALHAALAKAARAAGLPKKELVKYEASATHQEVLAGLGETEEDRQHVFGFFRRPTEETDARLQAVKALISNHTEFAPGDTVALCDTVFAQAREEIEGEAKRFEDRPALDLEVEAHDRFAEDRARIFTGRKAVLDTIADYIRGPERRPLVLHGESGSGKSAVMAKASKLYTGAGRVIRRFIGASPESASGHALLTSLCRQIAPGETPVEYAKLENEFKERMALATAEQPLVLFIDALDQLAASDPARDMTWLPPHLPPHVKVIVSTTDDVAGLRVQLEPMTQAEGGQVLDEWLREVRRTLQPRQRDKVLAHFERCGLPLYLKLAAEESRLWKSYASDYACTLGEGVAGIIDTLFDRLASNSNHGPTLVERSLSYLAAARYGLTEDEVLDVLTEDDAIWRDFDQRKHHEVRERRLPVVVWSRLSLDLEPYLTERAAPGGTVITFYHRQLAERAGVELRARHSDLARYFSAQPVPSARRAGELVFQQRGAHQWGDAERTLLDSQFLFAKCALGMVLDLDGDYEGLLQGAPAGSLPRLDALRLIHGALRLSMHILVKEPGQLASQMVGRLVGPTSKTSVLHPVAKSSARALQRSSKHSKRMDLEKFVEEMSATAPRPWFRPMHLCFDPPGGALLRTLGGHADAVCGVAVTPDGKWAVSASLDKTLKVWDLVMSREIRTLQGHSSYLCSVALTPNGKQAISASDDKTLKVWDLLSGMCLRTLEGHSGSVEGVAVTPDGKRVISASDDRTLKVWDLDTGLCLRTLDGHRSYVSGVAITADGRRAVSSSWDGTLQVWNLETGRVLRTLKASSDVVNGVAVTPDGKRAVSASRDYTLNANRLKVWDLESGRELRTLKGHPDSVYGVAVTPDGKRAISASDDRTLKVWDLETGVCLQTLEGHSNRVTGVAFTPDGKLAVSASWDRTLKVWDLETSPELRTRDGHSSYVASVAATADGKLSISASGDRTLKVWNPDTGRALRTLEGHSGSVTGVAFTPNGELAISASTDETLKMWDLEGGREIRTMKGHADVVTGVALTPDGKLAVSASQDTMLKVWDLANGSAVRTLEGHSNVVHGVAVTPDGKRAVSASRDKTLKVWDLETGRTLHTLIGHSEGVWCVAVTPDGKRAVSAADDKTLKVWDLETGSVLRTLEYPCMPPTGVAVTPDGMRAVCVCMDSTLKLWGLDTGQFIATLRCEAQALCCACLDEQRIVAGDSDGRVYFLALEE
jgi:WD40 repeat protein